MLSQSTEKKLFENSIVCSEFTFQQTYWVILFLNIIMTEFYLNLTFIPILICSIIYIDFVHPPPVQRINCAYTVCSIHWYT